MSGLTSDLGSNFFPFPGRVKKLKVQIDDVVSGQLSEFLLVTVQSSVPHDTVYRYGTVSRPSIYFTRDPPPC